MPSKITFSLKAEIHLEQYYILFLLFCQYKRANFYKNNGREINIPAVVYYSVWYQNGIKNSLPLPKILDL